MIENFIADIPNNKEVLGILIICIVILVVSFIRKLEKFIVIIFLVLSAYAAYLYFSGNEATDKQNEILKDPKKILEESLLQKIEISLLLVVVVLEGTLINLL